jgi:hypothetical protein
VREAGLKPPKRISLEPGEVILLRSPGSIQAMSNSGTIFLTNRRLLWEAEGLIRLLRRIYGVPIAAVPLNSINSCTTFGFSIIIRTDSQGVTLWVRGWLPVFLWRKLTKRWVKRINDAVNDLAETVDPDEEDPPT